MYGLIDVGRFVTDKFLTRFGVSGSGSVGRQGAAGDISFTLLTGALYYFTPDKTSSLYLGGDSALPISQSGTGDMMVNGRLGVQSAIRHNASFFVEGGYGATLTSLSSSGSLMSNLGVRILF
jgi:hypothetical protein